MLDDLTTWRIVLNEATPRQANSPSTVVAHGHYRDAYVEPSAASVVPGRLLAFGQIRPYKGMEDLVAAFHGLPSTMSLVIAGKPDSPSTAGRLTELSAGADNIRLDLRFVPDDVLVREIAHAELVVLPYRTVHNSGVALLALSLNRPILVRRSESTTLLQEEFGAHWVQLFEGELDTGKLSAALHAARTADRPSRVDMSSRDWELLGRRTAEVYIRALQRRRFQAGH
jgi:glycosyltransferase involved in cell wall biosynthesis